MPLQGIPFLLSLGDDDGRRIGVLHLVYDHAAAHGVHDAVDPTDAVQGAKRF